ncbi:GntR family transcriptional regulator [Pelagibacterium montanilacus]|uniref:GntR family transcriptional regulator n=1 Tax=Pelagibacterium montanilacus TaxID=2185280 RepID=UPI000F8EA528|nr:GntR family transcriptional regulator [Pelagibacterium montanilacus]
MASDVATEPQAHGASSSNLIRVLEDDILSGALRPGDRLDEQALARRFSVSRTPVREALRHLASSGLVEIRRNQGAMVRSLTTGELVEMFQVLAEMQGLAARLCARRMSRSKVKELRQLNEACERYADRDEHVQFFAANTEFHDAIERGAQNSFLMEENAKLAKRLRAYRWHMTFQPRRMSNSVEEHFRIVEAIERGDEEAAHKLMRAHVDLLAGSATDVLIALEAKING